MTKEEFSTRVLAAEKTLYHVACGILSREADREDAVQECILKAWERQSTLREADAFRAWITRILINECYNILRRDSRLIYPEEMPEIEAPEGSDLALREAVFSLDGLYRTPVILFYLEGFSIREIAGMLEVPEGTVKSRLYTGRTRLRAQLQEEEYV